MRILSKELEKYRKVHPVLGASEGMCGYFEIPTGGGNLRVISSGELSGHNPEWEHVSVSMPHRCPLWNEMQRVKEMFWDDDEVVVQIHPAKADYVNTHEFCLHLWKHKSPIATPPVDMV